LALIVSSVKAKSIICMCCFCFKNTRKRGKVQKQGNKTIQIHEIRKERKVYKINEIKDIEFVENVEIKF
jgi:hypothetical protein